MKHACLAAALSFLPLSAFAQSGGEAPAANTTQAQSDLLNDIEAWRATQLPHVTPPAPITARFEPRLDEIKKEIKSAGEDSELAAPRKELAAWKQDVLAEKFALARAQGLAGGANLARYSSEQTQQAEFSATLHALLAQDVAQRALVAAQQRSLSASIRNPSNFFDGASRTGQSSAGPILAEGAPSDPKDPARYAKVRGILISRGASSRVVDMAIKEAIRQNADPLLVLAVINQESGFNTHATSRCGALGLMQIMPGTGQGLGVHDSSMLYDAQTNLRAGIRFLKSLWGQFVGGDMSSIAAINPFSSHNVKSAVAAYNAGPGAVQKYDGVPPYRETQGYVKNVLGYYERLRQYMSA